MAAPKQFNITAEEIFRYWEANIAGAPLFPDGIKMLVGSFAGLFGTRLGIQLQNWSIKQGWVLAWALGDPVRLTSLHSDSKLLTSVLSRLNSSTVRLTSAYFWPRMCRDRMIWIVQ